MLEAHQEISKALGKIPFILEERLDVLAYTVMVACIVAGGESDQKRREWLSLWLTALRRSGRVILEGEGYDWDSMFAFALADSEKRAKQRETVTVLDAINSLQKGGPIRRFFRSYERRIMKVQSKINKSLIMVPTVAQRLEVLSITIVSTAIPTAPWETDQRRREGLSMWFAALRRNGRLMSKKVGFDWDAMFSFALAESEKQAKAK